MFRSSLGRRLRRILLRRPIPSVVPKLEAFMDELRKSGDSVGAKITDRRGACAGRLGQPVYNKLDADFACGMMSINAVKGVEIGAGFALVGADAARSMATN